jgi:hypothetical protein
MNKSLAFFGREREIDQLRGLHALRMHVLIVGPAGIGKTALLRQVGRYCPLLICEETSSLRRICDGLERQLAWVHQKLNVIERKNRLLVYLERCSEPVAFNYVAHTPPRVARFMAHLSEQIPIWIACRSDRPEQIQNVWEYLYKFTRVEIAPFTQAETSALVRHAVAEGNIQADAYEHIGELHRMSGGNPRLLEELLIELAAREYRMDSDFGLNLLEIDRQIHEIDLSIKSTGSVLQKK